MPQFLDNPGCFERHIQRRYNNPLFAGYTNMLADDDLHQARKQDEQDAQRFHESFQGLLAEMVDMPEKEDTEVILKQKSRIDELYTQCASLGGDHSREKEALNKLNDVLMKAVRSAAGNDPQAIEELSREQAAREIHMNLLEYALVADLLRTDCPVAEDELVATLLSEEPATLGTIMTLFDQEQRQELQQLATDLLDELELEDSERQRYQDRVSAMDHTLQ
ncbi:MAG TPA: hypothetical protein ENI64_07110 [Gammaproteobacteria bacterium]|nr:hypothetical protein [Gammaproteobacteria bacterium]